MKKIYLFFFSLLSLAIALFVFGCTPNPTPTPVGPYIDPCRVQVINNQIFFDYDSQKRLSHLFSDDDTVTFQYNGSQITETHSCNIGGCTNKTYYLNSNGYIEKYIGYYNSGITDTTFCIYNSNDYLIEYRYSIATINQSNNYKVRYTYNSDNITNVELLEYNQPPLNIGVEYYQDVLNVAYLGDVLLKGPLEYGPRGMNSLLTMTYLFGKPVKNGPKGTTIGSEWTFQVDADKKILNGDGSGLDYFSRVCD